MDKLEEWKEGDGQTIEHLPGKKGLHYLKGLLKALDDEENNLTAVSDKADISKNTARKYSKELEEKELVKIQNRSKQDYTRIELTEKGKEWAKKFEPALISSEDLEKLIKRFKIRFLRYPTFDEIQSRTEYRITEKQIRNLTIDYEPPKDRVIERKDKILIAMLYVVYSSKIQKYDVLDESEALLLTPTFGKPPEKLPSPEESLEPALENFDVYVRIEKDNYIKGVPLNDNEDPIDLKLVEPYASYFEKKFGRKKIRCQIIEDEEAAAQGKKNYKKFEEFLKQIIQNKS